MRDYIKKQLEQVSFANLNNYDPETCTFQIPKYIKPTYELNSCYIVQIPSILINNNSSVLATNWNNGSSPSAPYLKIFVSKLFGKNIYVDSLAYDIENKQDSDIMWSGWLPIDDITQIAKI